MCIGPLMCVSGEAGALAGQMLRHKHVWWKMSSTNHSSSSVLMLQIYVPRLPGLPNGFSYLPNRFGLQYEVRRACQHFLGSLCLLALGDSNNAAGAGDKSTCPFLAPARESIDASPCLICHQGQ